jgi:hypothetical protein
MKLLIIIFLLPILLQGKSSLELLAGSNQPSDFDNGTTYAINYLNIVTKDLGYEIGFQISNSYDSNNMYNQMTLPYAGIVKHYKFNRLPFNFFTAGGFGLSIISPATNGSNYLKSYVKAGLKYRLSRKTKLIGQYNMNYGKIKKDGQTTSFNNSQILIGLGFSLEKPKIKKGKPNYQNIQQQNTRRQGRPQNRSKSTYQQTQKLMNDLSWPTY